MSASSQVARLASQLHQQFSIDPGVHLVVAVPTSDLIAGGVLLAIVVVLVLLRAIGGCLLRVGLAAIVVGAAIWFLLQHIGVLPHGVLGTVESLAARVRHALRRPAGQSSPASSSAHSG